MLITEAPKVWRPSIVAAEATRLSLRKFTKESWPAFDPAPLLWSSQLDAVCDHMSYMASGDIRFLLINVPPRTSKSSVCSVAFPAWVWLEDPGAQFITASYGLQLSIRDCLRSRNLIDSPWFQSRWGHKFTFDFDQKTKKMYRNDRGGRRIALAVEGTTTGEGGDYILVDDPNNATEVESEAIRDAAKNWWSGAIASRLNNPDKSAWAVIGQRTGEDDLFGHIMRTHDMSEIVHLVLPNEYEKRRHCITRLPTTKKIIFSDPRKVEGELLNPKRISAAATVRLKRVMKDKYTLQYQQNPKGSGGKILKREAWKEWRPAEMPECDMLLTSWDTAFGLKQVNDYSARLDWGIFTHQEIVQNDETGESVKAKARRYLILLGAWRGRVPYHELKLRAIKHYKKVKPDYTLVEKKGSGISLCQDLSRAGVRGLRKVSVDHGGRVKVDKVERAHIASVVLDDGLVFFPTDKNWAQVVIDECSAFPDGTHDDFVDAALQAFQFLRRMNEVSLAAWESEEEDGTVRLFKRAKSRGYYG